MCWRSTRSGSMAAVRHPRSPGGDMPFTTVDDAIARIRRGEVLIVVDDEDRENEGDLTMAAARVNPEAINFMIRHGRGLVCMPVEGKRLDELHLEPMVAQNTSSHETAFTVSIDHRTVTTGISAHERSVTIQKIGEVGEGVVVYIRGHEGRGIGLTHKLKAYELQENGLDTVEANEALGFAADLSDYGTGAQILVDLGISTMRFMSNNPKKVAGIEGYGLRIVEWVPLQTMPTEENIEYLRTKRDKLGHRLDLPSGSEP